MNYITPATSITAAHWNDIFQAADARLTTTLGGLSAVLAGTGPAPLTNAWQSCDLQWDRGFFFFDPLTVSVSQLHPLAQAMLQFYWNTVPISQQVMFLRNYNHIAITSFIAGLSTSGSPALGVQKLVKPSWSSWSAAIYPNGFGGYSTANMTDVNNTSLVADNVLDCSLGVIRVSVSGTNYPVTFNDITTAEHVQPLKPIDVFIIGALSWDATNWDKYSVVRVHNCGRSAATVIMGTASATLNPGESKCFRKFSGAWQAQGNYFHWMQSGDGRFLSLAETPNTVLGGIGTTLVGGASIFNPGVVADVCQRALGYCKTNFGDYLNSDQMWDASGILNNPNYTPQSGDGEKAPPSGGYLPALSTSDLLGDLLVHRGKVLVFFSNFASGTPPVGGHEQFNFTGFANLAAVLAALTGSPPSGGGITTRTLNQDVSLYTGVSGDSVTNLEIYQASGNLDLVDLSSPLVTFITSPNSTNPAVKVGASQSSSPPSLVLPWLFCYALDLEPGSNSQTYYWNNWAVDGNGNYYLAGTQSSVTVNTKTQTASLKKKVLLPTDAASNLINWIAATGSAGGILGMGNFRLRSTAFGPVLEWDETWPQEAGFAGLYDFVQANGVYIHTTKVVCDQSQGGNSPGGGSGVNASGVLRVTRSLFLQDAIYNFTSGSIVLPAPVWPRPDGGILATGSSGTAWNPGLSQMLKWNFPRTDQVYQLDRWFYHDANLAPMMPDWSSYTGSHWANVKYLNQLIGGGGAGQSPWWNDALSQNEFNVVASFYEANPIGVDTVQGFSAHTTGSQSVVYPKTGISAMRTWTAGTDVWGPFAAWLGGAGTFSWQIAPDEQGNFIPSSLQGDQLINNIEQGGGGLTGQLTPNALKCQCEQFNALASVIASLPPAKLNTVDPAASGITSLPDGANTFPYFNAGQMGTTLAPEETNVIQQMVWPRTAFYCWVPPGSGTDTIAAYLQSLLPSITINTSNGFGLTNDSPNQTVLKWISIADARTIYANFGLPFTLEAIGHPVSWVDDSNKNPGDPYFVGSPMGGHFIPDPGGSYLQAFGGLLSNGTAGGNGIFNGAVPESLIGGTDGIMQPPQPGSGNRNPALPATSLCVLREGLPDLCVAVIPQNYAYTDPTGVPLTAIQALGYDIVPVIADNTVESANGEVNIISGAGGAGQYEHLITTGLANGVVQSTPIDGWVPPPGGGL